MIDQKSIEFPNSDLSRLSIASRKNDTVKVAHYTAGNIMNLTASLIDGNDAAFTYLANYSKSAVPNNKSQYEIDLQSATNDAEKLFIYKKALVNSYHFFLDSVKILSPDLSYQGQKDTYSDKLDNSKWVTFNPNKKGSFVDEANKIRKEGHEFYKYI